MSQEFYYASSVSSVSEEYSDDATLSNNSVSPPSSSSGAPTLAQAPTAPHLSVMMYPSTSLPEPLITNDCRSTEESSSSPERVSFYSSVVSSRAASPEQTGLLSGPDTRYRANKSYPRLGIEHPKPRRKITDPFKPKHYYPSRRKRNCISVLFSGLIRWPYFPTRPVSLLFTLLLFVCFAATVTTFLVHLLNSDKQPLPWRAYCRAQQPFPHEMCDELAPVNVFVGVFSVASSYERRNLIRQSYVKHTTPGSNVQVKFIMGRPSAKHARRVALEMEMFNDIAVLDISENMNRGKTYEYFRWARENGTVPVFYETDTGPALAFKQADYIVKADDDAFINLSELERHLRITPRTKTYWGYLIRNLFMAGETYALSWDLVDYIATYEPLLGYTTGAEDQRTAKWIRMHPEADNIHWISERCYIYDHPKAGTVYSHGFLFPREVDALRKSPPGSETRGDSFSSVSEWKIKYEPPAQDLSIEEEIEALVEGGGRWDKTNFRRAVAGSVAFDDVVLRSNDSRVEGPQDEHTLGLLAARLGFVPGTPVRSKENVPTGRVKIGKDLWRDPEGVDVLRQDATDAGTAAAGAGTLFSAIHNLVSGQPGALQANVLSPSLSAIPKNEPTGVLKVPAQNYAVPKASAPRVVPLPRPPVEPETLKLRADRMAHKEHGGTVVVHYLKRNEWFMETALALLGRDVLWSGRGLSDNFETHPVSVVPVSENARIAPQRAAILGNVRLHDSPIVRSNGYIAEGRPLDNGDITYVKSKQDNEPTAFGRYATMPRLGLQVQDGEHVEVDVGDAADAAPTKASTASKPGATTGEPSATTGETA